MTNSESKDEICEEEELQTSINELEKASSPDPKTVYLHGTRLYLLSSAIWICTLLINMEVTIVGTALVTITNEFHSFTKASWVVSAYLITYTCFLVIWAKISDISSRKAALSFALLFFIIFSGACGAAQSIIQLIVFRALQGIGGAGTFSVSLTMIYEIVPKEKMPLYGGITFIFVALATTIGPILGGVIVSHATWRWVFLLNVPIGGVILILILLIMPFDFPNHGQTPYRRVPHLSFKATKDGIGTLFSRIDIIGAILLIGASFMLVVGLLETSIEAKWSSPTIIVLLVIPGLLWLAFLIWEWRLSRIKSVREPIFPWRFTKNRVWMAMLLMSFLVGISLTVLTIELPQRFQAVNANSPSEAGIHLLAFSLAVPIGSFFGNGAAANMKNTPAIALFFCGSVIQLLGISLMTMVPNSQIIPHAVYAYEVITGVGAGLGFSVLMISTPGCIEPRDIAVGSSVLIQLRMIGSSIGIAVSGTIVNNYLTANLQGLVSESHLAILLQDLSTIPTLSEDVQNIVRETFGEAYAILFKIIVGLSVAQVLAVAVMWRRPQLLLHQ